MTPFAVGHRDKLKASPEYNRIIELGYADTSGKIQIKKGAFRFEKPAVPSKSVYAPIPHYVLASSGTIRRMYGGTGLSHNMGTIASTIDTEAAYIRAFHEIYVDATKAAKKKGEAQSKRETALAGTPEDKKEKLARLVVRAVFLKFKEYAPGGKYSTKDWAEKSKQNDTEKFERYARNNFRIKERDLDAWIEFVIHYAMMFEDKKIWRKYFPGLPVANTIDRDVVDKYK